MAKWDLYGLELFYKPHWKLFWDTMVLYKLTCFWGIPIVDLGLSFFNSALSDHLLSSFPNFMLYSFPFSLLLCAYVFFKKPLHKVVEEGMCSICIINQRLLIIHIVNVNNS